MKALKTIFLIIVITAIFEKSAFSENGFEFILNVPLGLGIGIPTQSYRSYGYKSGVGFDGGITSQIGYLNRISDLFGINVLAELGYAHSSYTISYKQGNYLELLSYSFNNFQIGLLTKLNIDAFAIGLGIGVKIPMTGKLIKKYKSGNVDDTTKQKLKRNDITDIFSPSAISYVKITFDYSIFFTEKLAMNVGLYLGYDMPLYTENDNLITSHFLAMRIRLPVRIIIHDINLGLQLGFRFSNLEHKSIFD